jgi:hypothetical protein
MKRAYPVFLMVFLVLLFSCRKYVQQQEKKAALAIITDGLWYVSGYMQNDSDITASFSGYLFKFDANNTVAATKVNVVTPGIWSVDIASQSITTNFPAAGDTLRKLNKTWKITDSYTDSVSARSTDTTNHTSNILQLRKQ